MCDELRRQGTSLTLAALLGLTGDVVPDSDDLFAKSFGLSEQPGALIATAPGLVARFTAHGPEFMPALGPNAPETLAFAFQLGTIEPGATLVHRAESGIAPRREGFAAVYDRGAAIEERYEVTAKGIEQSFVFARRIGGSGDLVVRGRIDSNFASVSEDGDGYVFANDDGEGLHVSGVLGIDARGRTSAGSIRIDGSQLELRLPAAFVDGADFPLVLDPLVSSFLMGASGLADRTPSAAHDRSTGLFLVAWERVMSTTDTIVIAQRVDENGATTGAQIVLGSTKPLNSEPAVANVDGADSFVVTWVTEDPNNFPPLSQLMVSSVDAATGNSSALPMAIVTLPLSERPQHHDSIGRDSLDHDSRPDRRWNEPAAR